MSKARALKPPKKRCEKCRYWQRIELGINEGKCVRFPPVFVGLDHEGMPTYETTEHCVGCKECLAMVGPFVTKKQTINRWNTRAERTCENESSASGIFTCSYCGVDFYDTEISGDWNYCPNCGAKVVEK